MNKKAKSDIERFESKEYDFFTDEVAKLKKYEGNYVPNLKKREPNKSGSYTLDYDLICPFAEGGIYEIFGPEGCGKTTLALEIVGQALGKGKKAFYLNQEASLTESLLKTIRTIRPHLDKIFEPNGNIKPTSPLKIDRGETGEQALEIVRLYVSQHPKSIVIVDSIDACVPAAILEGSIGDQTMGAHGKLMSDAVRKIVGIADKNDVGVIFINQQRDKMTMFGSPIETPGGKAVRFYSWHRIQLFKPGEAQMIKEDDQVIGQITRYKIIKNKFAPGIIEGEIPLLYFNGFFREQEIVTLSMKLGILEMGGRGGQQILLPTFDQNGQVVHNKTFGLSRLKAAKRLLIDKQLMDYLDTKINIVLGSLPEKTNPIFDEIQDTEG